MREFARLVGAVLAKDLRREARTGELLLGSTVFGLVTVLVFAFALPVNSITPVQAVGFLWIAVLFASQIGVARSVEVERADGRLDAIRVSGVDLGVYYLAKALSLLFFLSILSVLLLGLTGILLNLESATLLALLPSLALGVLGIALVGPLVTFLAASTRMREILSPFLFLILFVPLVLCAAMGAHEALEGTLFGAPVKLLLGYDLFIGGAVLTLAPAVLEE